MHLTPEQETLGRRTFLKALAGTPALGLLGAAAIMKGPVAGGPVRLGIVGVGGQGRALLNNVDPAFGEIRALCDINPAQLARADEALLKRDLPKAAHYAEWREMLEKEDLEAVLIAVPLWMHTEVAVGCLEAGKHVLCEKMMAWDVEGCERMIRAAERSRRILEIGYQRRYNGVYEAAYEGIVRKGLLGDIHHVRMVWHRNGNWRRTGQPPSPDYDPSRWGYPTFEHLLNWRLYWKYSQGLFAELASHQINAVNWFLNAAPVAVTATGGVHRFNDGREVPDHIYAIWEYPGGRTATYSSVESNAFENRYEVFFGTKATLLVRNENEALLFEEGGAARESGVLITPRENAPAADASETRPGNAPGAASSVAPSGARPSASRQEISRFCAAVRVGTPIACGPHEALHSAKA
ncbi:MAG TPA: Gfo/Idh/MocA family oxidoreductase, partial [Vicinamibacterales bacterium]|nr:Gfo/Idh/MocA family oxidoreductase [Vicinamibacterales bacterium]